MRILNGFMTRSGTKRRRSIAQLKPSNWRSDLRFTRQRQNAAFVHRSDGSPAKFTVRPLVLYRVNWNSTGVMRWFDQLNIQPVYAAKFTTIEIKHMIHHRCNPRLWKWLHRWPMGMLFGRRRCRRVYGPPQLPLCSACFDRIFLILIIVYDVLFPSAFCRIIASLHETAYRANVAFETDRMNYIATTFMTVIIVRENVDKKCTFYVLTNSCAKVEGLRKARSK